MMVALFAAAALLTVGFVLWPFVRRVVPELPGGDPAGDTSAELRLQQSALYDALSELEFAYQAGQAAVRLRLIERAVQAQPRYLPAWQAKGMLHYAQGNDQEAIAAWETYLRLVPDSDPHRQAITTLMAQAKQRLQAAPAPDATPTTVASATISGTVRLAAEPSLPLPEGAALFLIARTGSGPPLAVKRMVNPQFPVYYSLGPENLMFPGRPFTGQVDVSARMQVSGTVGPLQPGDLVGHYAGNPVTVGATGVDIVLTPQR
jgi:cytochrome c-type biogenesis protein CcmH